MRLSTLALWLGGGFAAMHVYPLMKPAAFREGLRRFPRSLPWGYCLMGLGTVWFLHNLQQENISDFAAYKPLMLAGFAAVGLGTCIYVRDFLAVRGLAIVLLLLAHLTLETQRWADTPWKNVLTVWAYEWVVMGIWLTVSPWRLRDWIDWATGSEARLRWISAARLALGVFIFALGLTVFR